MIRGIHVDTMANYTFFKEGMHKYLRDIKPCSARIQVANSQ